MLMSVCLDVRSDVWFKFVQSSQSSSLQVRGQSEKINIHIFFFDYYHSVVDEVDDDLEDAAEAGGQGDPQVDLISSGVGDVFLRLCPEESGQEVVS